MARTRKTPKAKTRFYRCARCHSLIPHGYEVCGCGYDHGRADRLIQQVLTMFPGSYEITERKAS